MVESTHWIRVSCDTTGTFYFNLGLKLTITTINTHTIDLKHLAIKIYSVRVNSMPEKRTVSTFTWLTPALRSRMSVSTMTAMTQIRQYYKTEQNVSTISIRKFLSRMIHTLVLAMDRF